MLLPAFVRIPMGDASRRMLAPRRQGEEVMGKDQLGRFEEVVALEDVPAEDAHKVLRSLIDYLGLELVQDRTPDYTAYRFRKQP